MRILQLVNRPQLRGAEMDAIALGHELVRQGANVRTAYLYGGPDDAPTGPNPEFLHGRPRSMLDTFPGFEPGLLGRLRELIATHGTDVLVAGGGRTVKYAAGSRLGGRPYPRALVWRNIGRSSDWLRGAPRVLFYTTVVLPRVDAVVSMTRHGAADFREVFANPPPITCIPPGIDPGVATATRDRETMRRALDASSGAFVVLWVGALSPEKRPDRALSVIAEAATGSERLEAWLVGDGPLLSGLRRRAGELDIDDRVRFLGRREDVPDLMGAADVLLLTSDTEGLPRVILEAAFVPLPVVATAVGGIAEVIEDRVSGRLLRAGEDADMARALLTLEGDSQLRARLATSLRSWAYDNASLRRACEQYRALFTDLLRGLGETPPGHRPHTSPST